MSNLTSTPKFGPLTGLKVLVQGQTIAGPYAGGFMAEYGATVVNIENPRIPDSAHVTDMKGLAWDNGHRNQLDIALATPTPEGKEIFKKLIAWADIFNEGTKGGTFAKWGFDDEALWAINPKLVIVHESGYGQSGDPGYVNRGSFDMIGQAFGGTMKMNGLPAPGIPIAGRWAINDYMTTLFVYNFSLAAYIKAQKTGHGDSIDICQFETGWKTLGNVPMRYFMNGEKVSRHGYDDGEFAGVNTYPCADGEHVFISVMGLGIMNAAKAFFGFEGDADFTDGLQIAFCGTPAGDKLNKAIRAYCAEHTAVEVEAALVGAGVAASRPYDTKMALEDPHVQQRGVFDSWYSFNNEREVRGVGVVPNFKNEPGRIWRSAPLHGQDNYDVLKDLGYDDNQIADLYGKGVIGSVDKRVWRPTAK